MTLTASTRALLAVVRRQPDREFPLGLIARLTRDERRRLLELLEKHGLTGWAHSQLQEAKLEVASDLAEPLAQSHLTTTAQSILLLTAYDRISKALSAEDIDHIPLKGVHFLRTLYADDPGVRSMGDIDLLVRRADLNRADEVFRALGSASEMGRQRERQERFHHHHHYHLPAPVAITVELHWRLSSAFGLTTNPEALWTGAARSSIEDATSAERELDRATLIHWLLVHVANHGYSASLKWLVDLRLLLEQYPEALSEALEHASGTVGACAYALALVATLTGSPVARQGLGKLRPHLGRPRWLLFNQLARPEVFFDRGDFLRKKWPAYGMKLVLTDGPKARIRLAINVTGFKAHLEGLIGT